MKSTRDFPDSTWYRGGFLGKHSLPHVSKHGLLLHSPFDDDGNDARNRSDIVIISCITQKI